MLNPLDLLWWAVLISLAGGLGSVLRLILGRWNGLLPWGILAANSLAAFAAGLASHLESWLIAAVLVIGVMGGLSTFSSWAAATAEFWRSGKRSIAISNGVLTLVIPSFLALAGEIVGSLLIK